MTPEESITLIKANLAEVLNPEIIDNVILKENRPLRIYWGTAPTGKPHCGYFVPMVKIAELLHAGCHVKILLADKHAHMDSYTPIESIKHRCEYYRLLIRSSLKAIGVDVSKLEFVVGSSFQDSKEYQDDRFRFSNNVTVTQLIKAGSEVVKQGENPTLGSVEYPIWQSLDEEYLDVDAELGGVDQRKLFTFAIDHMPKLGYKVRAHLMNAMVPGLGEAQKMSSSEPSSKINLLDTPEEVTKKLRKAPRFTVETRDGDTLAYEDLSKLKEDYASDALTPQMIKPALIKTLHNLLDPIRKDFAADNEWQRIAELAYPVPVKPVKANKHKPGNEQGNDAAPEYHAETFPPGTAPAENTFRPNPESNYTTEALNMPALDMPGSKSKDIYNSIDSVHGRPLIGQENREIRGVHPRKRKKERSGLEGVGASTAYSVFDKVRDTVADKPNVEKGQRGYSGRREGGLAADGAESMPPVKADERAVREGPHKSPV
ncbi:hypothetical protein FANTH_10764 [Fusarium anthophilum]|uniref:Tyrosine--tRNA ligase n=1 Tax=Fusarium anthophilum TaxID=48485 RepID=A0A8H5DVR0_9HYPO|nr:hypothetical protein FANTH_10764 [Fusarium anthophilum]